MCVCHRDVCLSVSVNAVHYKNNALVGDDVIVLRKNWLVSTLKKRRLMFIHNGTIYVCI